MGKRLQLHFLNINSVFEKVNHHIKVTLIYAGSALVCLQHGVVTGRFSKQKDRPGHTQLCR